MAEGIMDKLKKLKSALSPAPTSPKEVDPKRKELYQDVKDYGKPAPKQEEKK